MYLSVFLLSMTAVWVQSVSSQEIPGVDDADFLFVKEGGALNSTLAGTNTYAGAINYGRTHPTRDGGTWANWCASLMVRAGNLPSPCPSAIECYHKSTIVSHDVGSAPSGAFHWWDIGQYGHVAMATDHGWAMMASCKVTESWGDCIGNTDVVSYTAKTGAKYLGWSYDYNRAEIADVHKPVPPTPPSPTWPRSATEDNGVPDTNYYARQQIYASHHGYVGAINGILGPNSWAGTQRGMRDYGYTGADNGIPGVNTYMAMQRLAAKYGYAGAINGILGPNSYKGLARYFNTL